ncbi:hypothetical protein [Planotetraspora sp. GP83]|uniref:hypothetical protein n=1 Tax=Planotetraspora sp. GP83 TaxID=3156264 RepID=UPI0035182EFA
MSISYQTDLPGEPAMYYDYSMATERASELLREADSARVAHRLASARRWRRLASWAQEQAQRATHQLG